MTRPPFRVGRARDVPEEMTCHASWDLGDAGRRAGWQALATAPPPVGYDPSLIPGWDDPTADTFGILRLAPGDST